jgi:hypothetical protein
MQRIFISHTTRDQRDLHLAHSIAKGLELREVKSWIAPNDIPAGTQWEAKLVQGLMKQATHFLVILSAASIQSKWVKKEIALAKERFENDPSFVILPLETGTLSDYPDKDFLAQFQHVPYENSTRIILNHVAKAIGLRPAVPNQFGDRIDELTKDFVGRDYVFKAITRFTTNNAKGYFLIEGDPGVGKSAILAEFVSRSGCIAHFNIQSQGINSPRSFLAGVCSQIIQKFDLDYTDLSPEATQDGAFLSRILQEAAQKLEKNEKLVVAVDALDEVETQSQTPGSNILYLPATLSNNVIFILSSRAVPLRLSSLVPFERYDLMQQENESRKDIETFIRRVSNRPGISGWLKEKALTLDDFIHSLAEKSQNNFMYLKYVLQDIEGGLYRDLEINELPTGLENYYEKHWRRMGMESKPLPKDKIKIIYILCEVRRPVSRSLLADFAKEEDLETQAILDEWGQFLREHQEGEQKQYSLYHASFRDFLHRKDIVQAAGVTLEGINEIIADNLWDAWKNRQ